MYRRMLCSVGLLCSLLFYSCVDKDDPSAEKPSGNWVLAGMNHSSNVLEKSGGTIRFVASTTDAVWAVFSVQPTTAINTYKIVQGPAAALAADEMLLRIDYGTGESWFSTGAGNPTATVARDGLGNIRITVPVVHVRHYVNNMMQNDSTQASCVLIYK